MRIRELFQPLCASRRDRTIDRYLLKRGLDYALSPYPDACFVFLSVRLDDRGLTAVYPNGFLVLDETDKIGE